MLLIAALILLLVVETCFFIFFSFNFNLSFKGFRDIEGGHFADENTTYEFCSLTKTVTALMLSKYGGGIQTTILFSRKIKYFFQKKQAVQ